MLFSLYKATLDDEIRRGFGILRVSLYAAWYLQAGCLKRQFNKALRRGYPGFDHLKL